MTLKIQLILKQQKIMKKCRSFKVYLIFACSLFISCYKANNNQSFIGINPSTSTFEIESYVEKFIDENNIPKDVFVIIIRYNIDNPTYRIVSSKSLPIFEDSGFKTQAIKVIKSHIVFFDFESPIFRTIKLQKNFLYNRTKYNGLYDGNDWIVFKSDESSNDYTIIRNN